LGFQQALFCPNLIGIGRDIGAGNSMGRGQPRACSPELPRTIFTIDRELLLLLLAVVLLLRAAAAAHWASGLA